METKTFQVDEAFNQKRLDVFFFYRMPEFTRSHIQQIIEKGLVSINYNTVQKSGEKVKFEQIIEVEIPPLENTDIEPENLPLNIVYQDDDLLIINKSQGMVVHPSSNCFKGTLVNALLHHIKDLSGINGELRPGIVHRLDKDTSGLMIVAKNDFAHQNLAKQISEKTCLRQYIALLNGVVKKDEGTIETYITRNPKNRKEMTVSKNNEGKLAITNFKVERRYNKFTLVRFTLKTGRTHQIRVHAKYIGHPVVADPVYGKGEQFGIVGQLLHSAHLEVKQPRTGQLLVFDAPLPEKFLNVLHKLDTNIQ